MKKSLIALAVAGVVAVPSLAAAEVNFKGDARVRMSTLTMDTGAATNVNASTDSRIRLQMDAKLDGGVMVSTRFDMHERDNHGGTEGFGADWGWMSVPVGPVTLKGGRIRDNYGNRLDLWDDDSDQVQLNFKAGMMDVSIFRIMLTEGGTYDSDATGAGSEDNDTTSQGVQITGKAAGGNFGVRFSNESNPSGGAVGVDDVSGSTVDLFYRGKVGPGMLLAEYVAKSGDYHETGFCAQQGIAAAACTAAGFDPNEDASPNGLYIHWIQKFGEITGEVGLVQTNNYFATDNNFELFSTVGTAQDTALMNAGGVKTMQILALKGTMAIAKDTTATLGLAAATGEACDDNTLSSSACDAGNGSALDLVIKHKVNKSTTVQASYGTISMSEEINPAGVANEDWKGTSMGVNMSTKF